MHIIGIEDVLVYGPFVNCFHKGHVIENVNGVIRYIGSNGEMKTTIIPVGYCNECKKFFVQRQVLKPDGIVRK